jgi:hypothetical protein
MSSQAETDTAILNMMERLHKLDEKALLYKLLTNPMEKDNDGPIEPAIKDIQNLRKKNIYARKALDKVIKNNNQFNHSPTPLFDDGYDWDNDVRWMDDDEIRIANTKLLAIAKKKVKDAEILASETYKSVKSAADFAKQRHTAKHQPPSFQPFRFPNAKSASSSSAPEGGVNKLKGGSKNRTRRKNRTLSKWPKQKSGVPSQK